MGLFHLRSETEMESDPKGVAGSDAAEGWGGNTPRPQLVPSSALVTPSCLNQRMRGPRSEMLCGAVRPPPRQRLRPFWSRQPFISQGASLIVFQGNLAAAKWGD